MGALQASCRTARTHGCAGRLRPVVPAAGEPERAHARCSATCCGARLCYVPFRNPAIGRGAAIPDGFPEVRGGSCRSSSFTDAKPFASLGRLREEEGVGSDLRGLVVIPDCRPSRRHRPPGPILRRLESPDPTQWAASSDKGVPLRCACGIHCPRLRRPIGHGPRTGCRQGGAQRSPARRARIRRATGSPLHVGSRTPRPARRPGHRLRNGWATGGRRDSRCRR